MISKPQHCVRAQQERDMQRIILKNRMLTAMPTAIPAIVPPSMLVELLFVEEFVTFTCGISMNYIKYNVEKILYVNHLFVM